MLPTTRQCQEIHHPGKTLSVPTHTNIFTFKHSIYTFYRYVLLTQCSTKSRNSSYSEETKKKRNSVFSKCPPDVVQVWWVGLLTLTRGTLKAKGSMVVLPSRMALATSTPRTLHSVLGRKHNPCDDTIWAFVNTIYMVSISK